MAYGTHTREEIEASADRLRLLQADTRRAEGLLEMRAQGCDLYGRALREVRHAAAARERSRAAAVKHEQVSRGHSLHSMTIQAAREGRAMSLAHVHECDVVLRDVETHQAHNGILELSCAIDVGISHSLEAVEAVISSNLHRMEEAMRAAMTAPADDGDQRPESSV